MARHIFKKIRELRADRDDELTIDYVLRRLKDYVFDTNNASGLSGVEAPALEEAQKEGERDKRLKYYPVRTSLPDSITEEIERYIVQKARKDLPNSQLPGKRMNHSWAADSFELDAIVEIAGILKIGCDGIEEVVYHTPEDYSGQKNEKIITLRDPNDLAEDYKKSKLSAEDGHCGEDIIMGWHSQPYGIGRPGTRDLVAANHIMDILTDARYVQVIYVPNKDRFLYYEFAKISDGPNKDEIDAFIKSERRLF